MCIRDRVDAARRASIAGVYARLEEEIDAFAGHQLRVFVPLFYGRRLRRLRR